MELKPNLPIFVLGQLILLAKLSAGDGPQPDPYIVGGEFAKLGQFPHVCKLVIQKGGRKSFCAGSILSPSCILTAAHCLDKSASSVQISCGTLEYAPSADKAFIANANISTRLQHPGYRPPSFAHDVGRICLPSGEVFPLSEIIQPVRITDSVDYPEGNGVTCGWGFTSENGRPSSTLKFLQVPIHPHSACSQMLGSTFVGNYMFCAAPSGSLEGVCNGDSGGPVMSEKDGSLIGIVSWGIGCARPRRPGAFVRVAPYKDWIEKNILKFA